MVSRITLLALLLSSVHAIGGICPFGLLNAKRANPVSRQMGGRLPARHIVGFDAITLAEGVRKGEVHAKDVDALYGRDRLPFNEAMAAARAHATGDISIGKYRRLRRQGVSHESALASSKRFSWSPWRRPRRGLYQQPESGVAPETPYSWLGSAGFFNKPAVETRRGDLGGFEKIQYDQAIAKGHINPKTFEALYVKDRIAFSEALDASKQMESGDFSLNAYRKARRRGILHEAALEQARKKPYAWFRPWGHIPAPKPAVEEVGPSPVANPVDALKAKAEAHGGKTYPESLNFPAYVRLTSGGVPHDDAFKIAQENPSDNYVGLRASGIPHAEAEQAVRHLAAGQSAENYLELRGSGISHREIMEIWSDEKLTSKKGAEAIQKDYANLRQIGYSHAEAKAALADSDADEYKKLRQFGLSHSDALDVSKATEADVYLRLRREGIPHSEALALLEGDASPAEYVKLRAAHVPHAESLEIAGQMKAEVYLALLTAKISHRDAMDLADVSAENVEAYKALRALGETHFVANDYAHSPHGKDYALLRKAGIDPVLAEEASRATTADAYLAMSASGVSHADAVRVGGDVDGKSYVSARNAGATHDDALVGAQHEYAHHYGDLRALGFDHRQAIKLMDRGDSEGYLALRALGLDDTAAKKGASEGWDPVALKQLIESSGLSPGEAAKMLASVDPERWDDVLAAAKFPGISFEEAMRVGQDEVDVAHYTSLRKLGINDEEARAVLDNDGGSDSIAALMKAPGVTAQQAAEAFNTLDTDWQRDYLSLRAQPGVSHEEAMHVSKNELDTGEYLEFRKAGLSDEQALSLIDSETAFWSLRDLLNAQLPTDELVEVGRKVGTDFFADYLAARKGKGVSHAEALEVATNELDGDRYAALRDVGISPSKAQSLSYEDYDIDDIRKLMAEGITGDDAADVVENFSGSIDDYKKIRSAGITHSDARQVLNEEREVDDYLRLRKAKVSHANADAVLSDEHDVDDYLKMRAKGVPHAQASAVQSSEWDVRQYLQMLEADVSPAITHKEATEILSDEKDVDSYLSYRRSGKSHRAAVRTLDDE